MKSAERKQELLKIAYKLFLTRGYENTSIDDIIGEAGIAKGTYYYHFKSKEETLEEVINMMIEEETAAAGQVLAMPIPVPQKVVGIITALRPRADEEIIVETLNRSENIVMHEKINARMIEVAVPLLKEVVEEGIEQQIFKCDHIEERVRIILIISNQLFDDEHVTEADAEVFIDVVEKILGTEKGTMEFVKILIKGAE